MPAVTTFFHGATAEVLMFCAGLGPFKNVSVDEKKRELRQREQSILGSAGHVAEITDADRRILS